MSKVNPFEVAPHGTTDIAADAIAAAIGAIHREASDRTADRYFFHKLAGSKEVKWMVPLVRAIIQAVVQQTEEDKLPHGITQNFSIIGAAGDQALVLYGHRDANEQRAFIQVECLVYQHPPAMVMLPNCNAEALVLMQNYYTYWFNQHYAHTVPTQFGAPLSLLNHFLRKGARIIHHQIPRSYQPHQTCTFTAVHPDEPEAHYHVSFTYDALFPS